jgi:hypothetical protein
MAQVHHFLTEVPRFHGFFEDPSPGNHPRLAAKRLTDASPPAEVSLDGRG